MGTLEAISVGKDVARLVVAGQEFDVPPTEALSFSLGDYVVAGAASGAMAVIYHAGVPYIPGVSTVRVKASINTVDSTTGRLTVGGLTVDYTSQLSLNPTLAPAPGTAIEVFGTQPVARGTLLIGSGVGLTAAPEAPVSDRR
jgi:hypothetical protein